VFRKRKNDRQQVSFQNPSKEVGQRKNVRIGLRRNKVRIAWIDPDEYRERKGTVASNEERGLDGDTVRNKLA